MKGTITIKALPGLGVSLEMGVEKVSRLDVLSVFEALAQGFKLDAEEREAIGLVFAVGGLDTIPGVKATAVELSPELYKRMREMKEKQADD